VKSVYSSLFVEGFSDGAFEPLQRRRVQGPLAPQMHFDPLPDLDPEPTLLRDYGERCHVSRRRCFLLGGVRAADAKARGDLGQAHALRLPLSNLDQAVEVLTGVVIASPGASRRREQAALHVVAHSAPCDSAQLGELFDSEVFGLAVHLTTS